MCLQHGKEYNDAPVRKLSQSFSLEIVGGKAITPKQVYCYDVASVMTFLLKFSGLIKMSLIDTWFKLIKISNFRIASKLLGHIIYVSVMSWYIDKSHLFPTLLKFKFCVCLSNK